MKKVSFLLDDPRMRRFYFGLVYMYPAELEGYRFFYLSFHRYPYFEYHGGNTNFAIFAGDRDGNA